MVVRSLAAAPTPWSKSLAEPKIHETAYVQSSNMTGDIHIDKNVMIAPGASIKADEGSPVYISEGTNIQDGVVMYGLEQGKVVGDNKNQYSVWIGKKTLITHMVLIHGPAYIGDDCFIGFRSTVFNARVGKGCIVMMHALIQNVEVPAGKFVPSGAVITTQQQADHLPDVEAKDIEFANYVGGINDASPTGYRPADHVASITPIQDELTKSYGRNGSDRSIGRIETMGDFQLSTEISEQVRNLLNSGYKVGTEHVDERRFRTGSWQSCGTISSTSQSEVLAAIAASLAEYSGEYVRLIGIDPKAKRRVLETIIQRPDQKAAGTNQTIVASQATSRSHSSVTNTSGTSGLNSEISEQVRNLLNSGYKIGTEHVDERRFRTGSWQSCGTISSTSQSEVLAAITANLADYSGEYVRLIGIDPKAKRRVLETIIQRPDDHGAGGQNTNQVTSIAHRSRASGSVSSRLNSQTIEQVRNLLNSGYKVGTEHVDERRFRTGSWQSCSPIDTRQESQVVQELETCLTNHPGEYVRLIGIDPKAKRRVLETIIQRPDDKKMPESPTTMAVPVNSRSNGSTNSSLLNSQIVEQVRNLLNSGYKIGMEHVDERRYRTGSWQSCSPIDSKQESQVVQALETCLSNHPGEYVRLIGIDPKAKRRVAETIIQRP